MKISQAQWKLLAGLHPNGGVFDRYVRIVAKGEVVTTHGSTTPLTCFRDELIEMRDGRVELTEKGREIVIARISELP